MRDTDFVDFNVFNLLLCLVLNSPILFYEFSGTFTLDHFDGMILDLLVIATLPS